jgi:hypothetical protein
MCRTDISGDYEESAGQVEPIIAFCESERKPLTQLKCTARKIRSTRLGVVDFMVESGVDQSGERIVPDKFRQFVPKGKSFSFDTIWDVTRMHFLEYKQREEIQKILPFPISTGSISNLYKEGLAYFRACHEAAIPELRKLYRKKGRLFILQIDGTNEGGVWTHFQVRDSVSGNVLLAKRISTENQDDIETILREVETQFGRPAAVIADMSGRGIAAVENLWEGKVPLFICQFHFLRDIGKDILGSLHENLRKSFASCRLTAELNTLRKRFAKASGDGDADFLQGMALIDWIQDYRSELKGEGMPFDLAWKNYYERCVTANRHIREIFDTADRRYTKKSTEILARIRKRLSRILDDRAATRRYNTLAASAATFTKIRNIFHSTATDESAPLSRNATATDVAETLPEELQKQIENMVVELREKSEMLGKAGSKRYIKAAEQLEKYQARLRNHIEVDGKLHPLPRTNNLCEISFREEKRGIRRTNGKKNLARVFDQTPAEIMYLQNLRDPIYCKIVFGDRPIYEAFGTISQDAVKKILKTMSSPNSEKVVDPAVKRPGFLIINRNHFLKQTG